MGLAFYSERPVLNTAVLVNLLADINLEQKRLLVLYLNSSITLLQLLALLVETRGAWVDLHGKQVWSHVRIPDFSSIPKNVEQEALELFDKIGSVDIKQSLYERIKTKDNVQKKIDAVALKMLRLNEWLSRLDEIHDALAEELANLDKILKQSTKERE